MWLYNAVCWEKLIFSIIHVQAGSLPECAHARKQVRNVDSGWGGDKLEMHAVLAGHHNVWRDITEVILTNLTGSKIEIEDNTSDYMPDGVCMCMCAVCVCVF